MSAVEPSVRKQEETPVDDVRKVREKLSAQFDNDVDKLAEYAGQVAEEYREKLGLRSVPTQNGK